MPPKEFDTYAGVIDYLTELYTGTQVGNPRQASIYRNAAKSLKQWEKDGEHGVCPVKLAEFGIKYIGPTRGNTASEPSAAPGAEESDNDQVARWNVEGDRLQQAGNYAGAAGLYRRVLELKPDDAYARAALGHCEAVLLADSVRAEGDRMQQAGNFAGAAGLYRRVLELKPDDADARAVLADCEAALLSPLKETDTYAGVIDYLNELYTGSRVGNATQAKIYRKAAKSIKQWVIGGEHGVCPENLADFGIKYIGPMRGNLAGEPVARPVADYSGNDRAASLSAEGDRLRQDRDYAGAAELYRHVLAIKPDDAHARAALRDCEANLVTVKPQQLKKLLRSTDFVQLEEGIKLARLVDDKDEFPEELRELYDSAKQKSEDKRRADGQITTLMHVANLEERKKAVDLLTIMVQEQEWFRDSQKGQLIRTAEALSEANALWEQESADLYQRLFDKYEAQKLKTPRLVAADFEVQLQKPFHPQQRKKLEKLHEECEVNAVKNRDAAVVAAEARSADSEPVKALRLWYKAIALWPHAESWVASVDEAKRLAASWCVVQIQELLRQAQRSDNAANDRDKALDLVEQLIFDWPRDPRYRDVADTPAQFDDLGTKGRLIRDQIKEQDKLDKEFRSFEALIRQLVNAGRFSDARDKMQAKESDAGYSRRPEFRALIIEVGAGLSLREQFEQNSLMVEDSPEFVKEWALNLGNVPGHLQAALNELLGKSRLFIAKDLVREQLESFDFQGAGDTIKALKAALTTVAERNYMRERLAIEIDRIGVAKRQPDMKELFDKAEILFNQPNAGWRGLEESMRLFQHVGGWVVGFETGTPVFAESFFQYDARKKAAEVRDALCNKLKENFRDAAEFELQIEISERLLKYYASEFEFDRDSVRAVLVASAKQHVAQLAEAGADGEIGVWERLIGPWPGADVRGLLEDAKARQEQVDEALASVESAMAGNDPRSALQICARTLQLVTNKKLTDRRERIFREIEPTLLERIRRCGATSLDSVIGLALLAVEHLENFEEAAEREPAQRKSVAEFQRLKARLAAHRLANLLTEVRTVYGKLELVDGLPMQDGAPQQSRNWSRAIISNNWLEHDGVVAYARLNGLGDLRDIQLLGTNVRGYRSAYLSFLAARDALRMAFLDECFDDALTKLQVLIQLRADRGGSDVLSACKSEISVLDSYVGLQNVDEAARRLKRELQFWEEWKADCTRIHADVATARQRALEVAGSAGSLTAKQSAYSVVVEAAQTQEWREREAGANPPAAESEISKVRMLSATGRQLLQACEQWRAEAQQAVDRYVREIEALGGFPTKDNFVSAANALVLNRASPMFSDLLERARVIGAIDDAEAQRLKHFKAVFDEIMQRREPWWRRLSRRLGLAGW